MSPSGFRWFLCGVVAALVVIMLIVLRGNMGWNGQTPPVEAEERHGGWLDAAAPQLAADPPAAARRPASG